MDRMQTPICAVCGTTEHLLRCAKCKAIYYCSTAHQHIDWRSHKHDCKLLAKQKSNSRMQQLQLAVAATTLNNTTTPTEDACNFMHNYGCGSDLMCNTTVSAVEAGILSAVQPSSVMQLDVAIGDHLNTKAESVSQQNSYYGYHGNVDANSTTMDQIQYCDNSTCVVEFLPHQQQQQQQQQPTHHEMQQQQQFTHFNTFNSQYEKTASCQIGIGDENAYGNANERRYEDLCRNIINDMNEYGLSVVDDFLGMEKGLQILNEVHRMYAAGAFKDGQLVNNLRTEQNLRTIRGDKITWVKGVEPGCSNVGHLINQVDAVICRANTMKNNGDLGQYNIKERTKAMVACYPGSGSHYVMHVDNPNKDGRVITAIYYLNVNWDTKRSGGVLRICPEHGQSIADIEPKFDRLIFFWSDKRNPHEVQPAHRTRYAITVWYFDANEREAALNRCKYENNDKRTTTAPSLKPAANTKPLTNTTTSDDTVSSTTNLSSVNNTTKTNASEICT